ncbi:MAG: C25 family cysteine peptidase, partial [Anaerolineae bacterium]|nr:C25 family cysteine peptidase [Anaerolineae bacterium]
GDHAGTWEFQLSGFTTDTVRILDITDPISPVRIAAGPSQYGGLAYTLPFEQSLSGERRYLAVATAQVRSPISVSRDAVSDLHSTSNSADYIVISHGSLITSAQALADYRGTQGLRSQVVDVLDIYDEFNFGIPDAAAIREFLAYAYANWTAPAPAYVVLFGDGHYDPKDNLGRGEPSLVPPYLAAVDPWIRETAADNRYVTIDGDNLPDMFLGRLPANTLEQANVLVNKIIVYEQPSAAGAWQAKLLFVADNEDSAGNFAEDSNAVADHYIPDPYAVDKVYLGVTHPITVEARAAITAAINEGRLIVNYAGHGATQLWAGERLLSLDSMPFLINAGRLPFFVPMTCLEGYFIIPSPPGDNYAALAELVVRLPTGGAIASWSATGLGLASGHDYLNRGLYEAIFQEDMIELGPATAYAKQYLAISPGGRYFSDLLETYTLFGDPALRLAVLADVQIDKQIVPDRARFVAGDTITYTLTYSNAGSAVAYGVVITDILPTSVALPAVLTAGATITSRLGNTFVWDVADLYPGAGGIITITGVVSVTLEAPSFANTARISTISAEEDILDNTTTVFANAQQSYLPLILKGFATP